MDLNQLSQTVGPILGLILASSSVYAAVIVTKYRGRYDALESSLQLMSLSNGELREENERLRADILELKDRVNVVQSEVVHAIVDEIAQAAAIAVAGVVRDNILFHAPRSNS